MKCPNCGAEVLEGDQFCGECGKALAREKLGKKEPSKRSRLVVYAITAAIGISLLYWISIPPTAKITPSATVTQTTPTPTPMHTPMAVATPTGRSIPVRVIGSRFGFQSLQIAAGDTVVWANLDGTPYTIVEMNKKINDISLAADGRASYTFITTGNYSFGLYYDNMVGIAPSIQNIIIR